jgi:hypothetical protein
LTELGEIVLEKVGSVFRSTFDGEIHLAIKMGFDSVNCGLPILVRILTIGFSTFVDMELSGAIYMF